MALDEEGDMLDYLDMPIVQMRRSKAKYVDGLAVKAFLDIWQPPHIVVEQVSSRPGQGIASSFQFGMSYGAVMGLSLASLAVVDVVSPAAWKRKYGLIGTAKDAARLVALKLWPGDWLKRKKDGGRADAGLIALHGLHTLR